MNSSLEIGKILTNAKNSCYAEDSVPLGEKWCELVFDGLMCWAPTPPDTLANQSCSNKYIKSSKNGFATKKCDESGRWWMPEGGDAPWTNYTTCGTIFAKNNIVNDTTNFNIYSQWIPIIKSVTQFGYVISTLSLIVALLIFIHIKRLHCARNTLHINLFVSFVMRALMSLVKDWLFVKGTALAHDTVFINGEPQFPKDTYTCFVYSQINGTYLLMFQSWICKAITSSRNYFIISNYMFVLMEGAYLHNLLFLKLVSETGVAVYCAFGWTLPIVFVLPWIILRAKNENTYCWTLKSAKYTDLLLHIPIGLSITLNFVLFAIIVRVLFVKLTSMYVQQKRIKYQKLLRATLILVPLFGVPYTISLALSFHAINNPTFEILWLFFDQGFTAFQGLFASLVYCLLNGDVRVEIVRKYKSMKDRNREFKKRTRTISHTTQVAINEELQELQNCGTLDRVTSNKTDYF